MLVVAVLLFWLGLHHSVCLLLGLRASAWPDNTPFLPRPFLDYNVWLTQSAATRMGVHPSLESSAVSGYIIAEPCWARRTALCACHWMWLWVRLSGGWEATVKGFLPGLQQSPQNKQNRSFFGESFIVARQDSLPPSHRAHCVDAQRLLLTCLMFNVWPR